MSGECRRHGGTRTLPLPRTQVCASARSAALRTSGHHRVRDLWQRAARTGVVLARREVTKQFEVQITKSNERFGEPRARITLSKWWPGSAGRSPSLHISTPEQWTRVREIVDRDFGPRLGWRGLANRISLPRAPLGKRQLQELVRQNPELAREVLGDSADGATEKENRRPMGRAPRPIRRNEAKLGRPFPAAYRALLERLPARAAKPSPSSSGFLSRGRSIRSRSW